MRPGIFIAVVLALTMPVTASCANASPDKQGNLVVTQNTGIAGTVPKKSVHVKLRRSFKGEYSWDLTGDDVKEILKINRELKKEFPQNN
ncbi:MAG: hypothetical protein HQK89_09050 [Nitrospirae bacterium]|nr:hypothetical protein [Nitrospirota bacterium]